MRANGPGVGAGESAAATSAPRLLEALVRQAEAAGASDIHLEMHGPVVRTMLRLDGMMTPGTQIPEGVAERVFGRIKFLARLKTYQDSLPQDGRIDKADVGAENDLRVSTYPTVTGEKIVLRLFQGGSAPSLEQLGLPEEARRQIEQFLRQSAGLLLLTGPAGSGKTTTIHACLNYLVQLGGRHIITVEDPVERILDGVMQTEINEARGLTFATAARHLLRQDPQVLVVGEIRDEDTASIAVRAALSGHLMISTLHAGSCRGVWERLQVLCPDRSAALAALELIVNQRLFRRRCAECRGRGCATCLQTGYRGRVQVVEWVRVGDAIRRRLGTEGSSALEPASSLAEGAQQLVRAGVTDEREVQRVLGT